MCNIDFSFLNVFKKKKIEIQEWISDIENDYFVYYHLDYYFLPYNLNLTMHPILNTGDF